MSRPGIRHARDARPARCLPGPLRRARLPARAAVAAAMGLLRVVDAHAAPEPPRAAMRLEVVRGPGAEGCPDATFLRAEVARGLGADPFQGDAPEVLTVSIAREGPELTASLALRDREGETRWAEAFSTRSRCDELLSGAALAIVAHLLGAQPSPSPPERSAPPEERSAPPEERSAPPEERSAPPEAPPAEPSRPEPSPAPPQARRAAPEPPRRAELPQARSRPAAAPAPAERPRLEAGLGATLGLGIAPGAAAGMTLSLGVRRSGWSVAIEGRGLVSLAQEVKEMAISTRAFTATGVGCLHGRHLFGCGVASVGFVRFVPRHPWDMTLRDDALFSAGARLGSDWPLSDRWSAHGYAEATAIVADAVLRRQGERREAAGSLTWSSPPVGAALGLGIKATY
ncbi:hypothetical protein [Sorangium sp. So ce233]|uniref:hypothetical protein n=1 Tax=Sorangium sp. So ce233 TaxID=3133290 RepID=UPI003F5DF90F